MQPYGICSRLIYPTQTHFNSEHHTEKHLVPFLKSLVWLGHGWIRSLDTPDYKITLYQYIIESVQLWSHSTYTNFNLEYLITHWSWTKSDTKIAFNVCIYLKSMLSWRGLLVWEKRFYNRETIPFIRISQYWLKVRPLYHDWLNPLIKKKVNYLHRREGR